MLRRAGRRAGLGALLVLALICLGGGGAAWRLSQGPIPLDRARPAVERLLALQAPGGRARVGHAELAWFGASNAIGLRLTDVWLTNGSGREVLTGRRVEAGYAMGSLFVLRPALAHVAAERFFAAVSISPQGRYALGYDAAGAPGAGSDLTAVLGQLTGRTRPDRPLSWLRSAAFTDGRIAFRQVGAPLAWTGRVRRLVFHKDAARLSAAADVSVDSAAGPARLVAQAQGQVGLGQASATARLQGLVPAAVLPSVGAARQLALWAAPVGGRAAISYGARAGVEAADIDLASGAGRLRLRSGDAAVRGGKVRAHFNPRSGAVIVDRLKVDTDADQFELTGSIRLAPARAKRPAEVQFALMSQGGRLALADTPTQAVFKGFAATGRIVPGKRRLEFRNGVIQVGGAAAHWRGVVIGGSPGRSPQVDLDGGVAGDLGVQELLALWPRKLSADARDWVSGHIAEARAGQATFDLHLPSRPNGDQHRLREDALTVAFQVQGARVWLGQGFPVAEGAGGAVTIGGDHLHVQLASAAANGLTLGGGSVDVTHFKGADRQLRTSLHVTGPARSLLEVVDGPGDHVLTRGGFAPSRVGGRVDIAAEITRPLLDHKAEPPLQSYTISYRGRVAGMSVADAVLGLDLQAPAASFQGTGKNIEVSAPGVLGPYRGAVLYKASFGQGPVGRSTTTVDGVIDAALVGMGAPAARPMPLSGRFDVTNGLGRGSIRSAGFTGAIDWTSGPQARTQLRGALNSAALRAAGLPVSRTMAEQTPARLTLVRDGPNWSGALLADVYSGQFSFTPGEHSRLRYRAELTPAEAHRLGLGGDPAFNRPQPLLVDLSIGRSDGAGSYAVGPFGGRFGWSDGPGGRRQYRWQAVLGEADLHLFGLPPAIKPRGPVPVDVNLSGAGGTWDGSATVAGARLHVSSTSLPDGRRRVLVNGPATAATLQTLGALQPGLLGGQVGLSATLLFGPAGLSGGQLNADLTRAAFAAPGGLWTKPSGQPFNATVNLSRRPDGSFQATGLHAAGGGAVVDGEASWRAGGMVLKASNLHLPGLYDGALDVSTGEGGMSLIGRARFIDARRLMDRGGKGGSARAAGDSRIDLQAAEMQVSDRLTLHDVRAVGTWGQPSRRRMTLSAKANGGGAMSLSFYPDSGGTAIRGRLENVSDAAATFFDLFAFRGGVADITGRLEPDGADLLVDMHDVRLTHAPVLAQALTLGSFTGMANTLNGQGIAFTHVLAPLKIRGDKVFIGRARATGPALGVTTEGVLDLGRRTVALNGAIAPAYTLNGLLRGVPLVGHLLVPRKGEGVFGVTYTARGGFAAPKIAVNPLSLAAPGFLRRMFEGRVAAAPEPSAGGAPAYARR